ncbi:hypothetical protein [Parvularcula dongshanensis]|uniref:Uncharacterized protein n=1 Tax=Parvularcula dongshanensis TaxID=1173995 RepID=A0A840I6N1_9PROT|nr:hypothetical protein [Parvularcula dongshanensis]MBB4660122.1 hypothetical protein [Parvularcula dongshanensis]
MTARRTISVLAAAASLVAGLNAAAQDAHQDGAVHLPQALSAEVDAAGSFAWLDRGAPTLVQGSEVGPEQSRGTETRFLGDAAFGPSSRKLGAVSRVVTVAGQDLDLNGGIGKRGAYAEMAIDF